MHRHSLSIDARLGLVLVYLDTIKLRIGAAGHHANVPQLRTTGALAAWVADMSDVAASHVLAIHLALPDDCRSLNAPSLRSGL